MLPFITTGAILGPAAGIAPGPLLALVISETMEHGVRAGVKVALAPILKDLPIIIITIFILAKLSSFHSVLGVISILGAFFIAVVRGCIDRTGRISLPGRSAPAGCILNEYDKFQNHSISRVS